jgi:hypothetical protein
MWIAIPSYSTPEPVPGEEPTGYDARRMSREDAARVLAADPRCRLATAEEIGFAVVLEEGAAEIAAEAAAARMK